MKNLCWLATGGTIASRPSDDGLIPAFKAQEMLEILPELKQYGNIDCYDIMQLDSTNLQPKDWQLMAKYIENLYEKYDGFVITHGTDTLSWTTCALSCMLENLAKPVVVIGSQLTIEEEHTDAKENLNASFAMASSEKAGVYGVCGGQIIKGLWAKKLYSENMKSIQSVNIKPIATFKGTKIKWFDYVPDKVQGDFKVHYELETKIAQIKITPNINTTLLYNLEKLGYKGIVIEAYGAGGIPFELIEAIEILVKKGMVIICTTQCLYDGVHMERYEVGRRALKAGVIPAGMMTTEAVTIKLMVALGKKDSKEQIQLLFN